MPIRTLILNNFWLKLFSLVMATLIWFAVALQQDGRMGGRNPQARSVALQLNDHAVTVMKAAEDPRIFAVAPGTVDVTISGPLDVLQSLREKNLEVFVDLTDIRNARGAMVPVMVSAPEGVRVLKVEPERVQVELVQ